MTAAATTNRSGPMGRRERDRRGRGELGLRLANPFLVAAAMVGVTFLVAPLFGLLIKAPWTDLGDAITAPGVVSALILSLWTASVATVISVVIGVPLAWVLARTQFRGIQVVRAIVIVPLVLPPVVGGVALLLAFGREGVIGGPLFDWLGITIPFTPAAVVMAQVFVGMPFLVLAVEAALRRDGRRYETAAATLGASQFMTFRRVTVPLAAPAIAAGAVLCWARALGEFGATVTFAGALPGRTQTLPIEIYYALQRTPDAAIALSLLLLVVALGLIIALRGSWLQTGRR